MPYEARIYLAKFVVDNYKYSVLLFLNILFGEQSDTT